ncbi:ferritin-like domain-containing protein [Rubripirellula lacrimiformis]|uniref:ferritin-like domain-containing protein n=1 Tax=Rubripirellula lacrimiformis TaxID=1930273 RepID=UPI0011A82F48|nr:ferritin-like domain-containing protein [Rubripirellula lacrimiformis]
MTETFIKASPNHWKPDDFDLSSVRLDASLLHITKTICLLESRCDDYAEYLQAIFRDRDASWTSAIERWNVEECQHGFTLRTVCESTDPNFQFDESMSAYESLVSYHEPTGESVRGCVAAEMVSRCVVEALASALYRVLADAATDRNVGAVYTALAQDEARHYGMFMKMLSAEARADPSIGFWTRCSFALKRMLELEDGQIMFASCIVAGRSQQPIRRRREANWYLAKLYRLYRWKHLRYAVRMLLPVIGVRANRWLVWPATALIWTAVKVRLWLAQIANRVSFLPADAD